jgi:hypothetical protein
LKIEKIEIKRESVSSQLKMILAIERMKRKKLRILNILIQFQSLLCSFVFYGFMNNNKKTHLISFPSLRRRKLFVSFSLFLSTPPPENAH